MQHLRLEEIGKDGGEVGKDGGEVGKDGGEVGKDGRGKHTESFVLTTCTHSPQGPDVRQLTFMVVAHCNERCGDG